MGQIKPEELMLLKVLAIVFVIVVLIDFTILVAYLSRNPNRGSIFSPRWSLMDVWVGAHAFVAGMVPVSIVALIMIAILFGPEGAANIKGNALMLMLAIGMVGQTAFLVGIPAFFITQKYRVSLRQVGLPWPPKRQHVVSGVAFGIGMLLISAGLQLALMATLQQLAGHGPTQELKEITTSLTAEKMLKENRSPAMLGVMLVVAGVLAPLSEEVFFRGFLYNAAKYRYGIIAGIVVSSLVFAIVHFGPLAIIGIIPMGILLALAYELSGSLWVPIMMHATNNILAVVLTYLMPDLGI